VDERSPRCADRLCRLPACDSHKSLGRLGLSSPSKALWDRTRAVRRMLQAWIGGMAGWAMGSRTYGPGIADAVGQAWKAGQDREVEI
jgi:hypothetical protein